MSGPTGPKQGLLARIPSVDEVLKGPAGLAWSQSFPRQVVVDAVREVLEEKRKEILGGSVSAFDLAGVPAAVEARICRRVSTRLRPVINATGIVLHTNLGRAILSDQAVSNMAAVAGNYSNLEYDLEEGSRGERHAHTGSAVRQVLHAEDAIIVNNNAAAVLLCLNTLARGREVIVSRGELVEIGGSFRVPDVMASSGAVLREVGTTNKTHPIDYERAINENTALILKVHQSNYRIVGFSEEVDIADLVKIGKRRKLPVMFDLGSGCLVDLKPYGIHSEPTVQEVVKAGVDVVTFSGDKLLGGPQGGIIAGAKHHIGEIRKNPLARALRVDKMTIAAFEATLLQYLDPEKALKEIPVLRMLFQPVDEIRERAGRLAAKIEGAVQGGSVSVIEDVSMAGGGSLPEIEFQTFAVAIVPREVTVNELEERLRKGSPPVICRIKKDELLLDARTIRDSEIPVVVTMLKKALEG